MHKKVVEFWTGKSVLITGASSGIGKAVAEALAPFKVTLGLVSRREDKLLALRDELAGSGSKVWVKSCDVRNRQQIFEVVQAFAEDTGRIDAAWINSGVSMSSYYDDWRWENIDAMLETNLLGAIYSTRACLEIMVPQKSGVIVGVGSASSMRGLPKRGIYSLTKISLEYFFESLSTELPDIQFTTLHPGYVETDINRGNQKLLWRMPAQNAAQIMIEKVAKREKVYVFPWQMRVLYRIIRFVPKSIYPVLGGRLMNLSR